MKPLVVALGNDLVHNDASGVFAVREFGKHPAARHADVLYAGTDLLRFAEALRGRSLVVLVDAAEGIDRIVCFEYDPSRFEDYQLHAHHLSAVQALELIRWSQPEVHARFVWVLLPSQVPNE